ncbi:MAG: class I tRNA ligase family protein, partial [Candidatus Delongbacteria bacterium]|nr:class I tRNA ligase family protein [Candidatus Delongbacteria bacterium]
AMSKKYLGETLDFHTGGEDNKFPHHESEIAQSEVANGKQFANYWMHKSRVIVNNEKMSKSLGNFFTVSDLLKLGYTSESIRFTFVSVHYRSKLNFTEEKLVESQKTIDKFNDFIQYVLKADVPNENKSIASIIKSTKQQFEKAMDDDLNVSGALAPLFGFMKSIRKQINNIGISSGNREGIISFLISINSIFEVFDFEEKKEKSFTAEEQKIIDELIKKRDQFRTEKNWAESDKIRDELNRMGVSIADQK